MTNDLNLHHSLADIKLVVDVMADKVQWLIDNETNIDISDEERHHMLDQVRSLALQLASDDGK